MIIHKDTKSVETRHDCPDSNFGGYENAFVVDDGTELANKIIANYPYFEFVLVDGELTDITPTEIPPEPPPGPTPTELLQEDNASLWYENMVQSAKVESNGTEVASLWYSLMMGGI